MPVPFSLPPLFPLYAPHAILAFQFSSWYPQFSKYTIKSTVVRPLSPSFRQYLDADGVFVPDGAEDVSVVPPHPSEPPLIPTSSAVLQSGTEFPFRRRQVRQRRRGRRAHPFRLPRARCTDQSRGRPVRCGLSKAKLLVSQST